MAISYKKLWKLLIDKNMIKKDLRIAAGLSTNVIAKLGKNENVSTEVLGKICKVLDCEITDIMEFVDEEVFVGHNDGAVFAFEAEAVAALCGLDAVDEYEFAAAFFVVDIFHILLRPRGMGEEEGGDE